MLAMSALTVNVYHAAIQADGETAVFGVWALNKTSAVEYLEKRLNDDGYANARIVRFDKVGTGKASLGTVMRYS
jgi:hypothetical protein